MLILYIQFPTFNGADNNNDNKDVGRSSDSSNDSNSTSCGIFLKYFILVNEKGL